MMVNFRLVAKDIFGVIQIELHKFNVNINENAKKKEPNML
jgi:hypothetical protein